MCGRPVELEVHVTSLPSVASFLHSKLCFSNESNEVNLAYSSFRIDILYIFFHLVTFSSYATLLKSGKRFSSWSNAEKNQQTCSI